MGKLLYLKCSFKPMLLLLQNKKKRDPVIINLLSLRSVVPVLLQYSTKPLYVCHKLISVILNFVPRDRRGVATVYA